MSSESPKDTPADRSDEPFARGRIQWGRPPQTTFRVGPLPSAGATPPPPRSASAAGILTGSMIPSARPAESAPLAPEESIAAPVEAEAIVPPPPLDPEPEPVVEPVFEAVAPEPVVEPEPVVTPEPEPVAAARPQEIVIEPEAAEPAVTVPPLSGEAKPAARPRELPSVVVTPTLYATMGAAVQKVTKGDRWTVVAGVVAVVVIGGFIWLATLPGPRPVAEGPTPLAAGAAPLDDTPLVEETFAPAEVEDSAPAARAPAAAAPVAATPAPATVAPRRPATTPATPIVIAPTQTAPRPYIETAPLVIDPPTPAEPAETDPDAPIVTRPQPLD